MSLSVDHKAPWLTSYLFSAVVSFATGVFFTMLWCKKPPPVVRTVAAVVFKEEMKMSLVVRKDLKMGTGKIAAQCAHAAVAVVESINAKESDEWSEWLSTWLAAGSAKIALQCDSESALLELAKAAKESHVPHYVIRDAGRTQIAAGSKTVVVIGPAPKSKVDLLTGHLKLL